MGLVNGCIYEFSFALHTNVSHDPNSCLPISVRWILVGPNSQMPPSSPLSTHSPPRAQEMI